MKLLIVFVIWSVYSFSITGFGQTSAQSGLATNSVALAAQRGEQLAKTDIAKGAMQIRYSGKPWSTDKPLVDEQSQLPVKIVEGCVVTREFVAETDAYNTTMRRAAKKTTPKKPPEPIGTNAVSPSQH